MGEKKEAPVVAMSEREGSGGINWAWIREGAVVAGVVALVVIVAIAASHLGQDTEPITNGMFQRCMEIAPFSVNPIVPCP